MADTDPLSDSLEAFFGGRKIGWTRIVQGRWQWRGEGYDEGWEDATDDELRELHRLLGEYLISGYDRAVLVDVIVYHWPTKTSGCGCGWAVLGASYAEHVADVYEASVAARAR